MSTRNNNNKKQKQKQKKQKQKSQPQSTSSQAAIERAVESIARKRRAADLRAARLQLDVFSRKLNAKWTDDNAARSIAMRTRTFLNPPKHATYDTIAFAVVPALAPMIYYDPAMVSNIGINTTWAGTTISNVAYGSLLTEAAYYRIVGFGFRLLVTQAALNASGVITVMSTPGGAAIVANVDGLPAANNVAVTGRQTYAFSAGQVIEWYSKPTDNSARHYLGIGQSFAGAWESCAVFCTGLSTGASVQLEVRMDLEVLASAGNILNYSATDAAPYEPGVLAAVADVAANVPNSISRLVNTGSAMAFGARYLYGQMAGNRADGGVGHMAAPAA